MISEFADVVAQGIQQGFNSFLRSVDVRSQPDTTHTEISRVRENNEQDRAGHTPQVAVHRPKLIGSTRSVGATD